MRPGCCHDGHLQPPPVHLHLSLHPARALCGSHLRPCVDVCYPDVVANLLAPAHTVQGVLLAGACQHQVVIQ